MQQNKAGKTNYNEKITLNGFPSPAGVDRQFDVILRVYKRSRLCGLDL
jgi:hypothetical protein